MRKNLELIVHICRITSTNYLERFVRKKAAPVRRAQSQVCNGSSRRLYSHVSAGEMYICNIAYRYVNM